MLAAIKLLSRQNYHESVDFRGGGGGGGGGACRLPPSPLSFPPLASRVSSLVFGLIFSETASESILAQTLNLKACMHSQRRVIIIIPADIPPVFGESRFGLAVRR